MTSMKSLSNPEQAIDGLNQLISHWLDIDIISRVRKQYQIKNKETKTSLT